MNDNDIFRTPTRAEINEIMADAHRMRNQAMADTLRGIGRGLLFLGGFLRSLVGALADAREARATYEELSRLSDRELADMGLTRGDIPAVVAGVYRGRSEATPEELTPTAPAQTRDKSDELPAAA